jgi:hippurate hydrolase
MRTDHLKEELTNLRREFHSNPELNFDVHETSSRVINLLNDFGLEVHKNIGRTGVVGVLKKGTSKKVLALELIWTHFQ